MLLLSVKTSRFPDRVYLKLSNGLLLPLYIDDFVSLSLHSGQELTDDDLTKFIDLSLQYLLKNYSLRQIALSPKSEYILSRKLKVYIRHCQKKYRLDNFQIDQSNLIQNCLTYLKDRNLLSESNYIQYFLKKNHHKSLKEINYLLKKEGIVIDLSQYELNTEVDKIKTLITKKRYDLGLLSDLKYKNKILSYLYRKGFSLSDIKIAIDEMLNSR